MMSLPFLLIALAAPATGAGDPHAVLPPDLRQADADADRAQAQGDVVALRRLLADDYVLQNSSGKEFYCYCFPADAAASASKRFFANSGNPPALNISSIMEGNFRMVTLFPLTGFRTNPAG